MSLQTERLVLGRVSSVGGFCFIILCLLSWTDGELSWHLRVFGWAMLTCLVIGPVLLAFSVSRSTKETGWPWPH